MEQECLCAPSVIILACHNIRCWFNSNPEKQMFSPVLKKALLFKSPETQYKAIIIYKRNRSMHCSNLQDG